VALGIAIPWGGPVSDLGRPRPEDPSGGDAPVPGTESTIPVDARTARRFVEILFARHQGEIYAFLLRMVRDPELAADLTQDAFIRAFRACGTLDDPAKARAWLYQIAHRVALDEIRRRRIIRFVPWTGEARGAAPSPERLAMDARLSGELERALGRIPERQRSALLLAEVHDLTGLELASALGTSHVAARALLTRARESLRRALAEERAAAHETPAATRGERREADR
jgi:RNA polymerase sigma-70 factor (ECF subfamily)